MEHSERAATPIRTAHAPQGPGAPVLVADHAGRKIYAIGSSIAVDDRVSWVPRGTRGHQPVNCYVILDGGEAMLIDSGVAAQRDAIVGQLSTLVRPGSELVVFLTRPLEFNCSGTLDAIAERFKLTALYAPGVGNPLDAYELDPSQRPARVSRVRDGAVVALGDGPPLEVLEPPVRVLATDWIWEPSTRTMFTSDLFGHLLVDEPVSSPVICDRLVEPDLDAVRGHLTAKIWWLRYANPSVGSDACRRLLIERPVATIAPGYGRLIRGRSNVLSHAEAMARSIETSFDTSLEVAG